MDKISVHDDDDIDMDLDSDLEYLPELSFKKSDEFNDGLTKDDIEQLVDLAPKQESLFDTSLNKV